MVVTWGHQARVVDHQARVVDSMTSIGMLEAVASGGVILDVRSEADFSKRHIDGAHNIPLLKLYEQLEQHDSPLAAGETSVFDFRDRTVVIHCATGVRSKTAAEKLKSAGFNVIDIGGIDAWEGEGLPPKFDGCVEVPDWADEGIYRAMIDLMGKAPTQQEYEDSKEYIET